MYVCTCVNELCLIVLITYPCIFSYFEECMESGVHSFTPRKSFLAHFKEINKWRIYPQEDIRLGRPRERGRGRGGKKELCMRKER